VEMFVAAIPEIFFFCDEFDFVGFRTQVISLCHFQGITCDCYPSETC
jgi:hypothetical protein